MTTAESKVLQIVGTSLTGLAEIAGTGAAVASTVATTVATASDFGARAACSLYQPIQMANYPFMIQQ